MTKNLFLFLGIIISGLSYGNNNNTSFSIAALENSLPEFSVVKKGHTYGSISEYMARSVKYPEGTESFGLIGTAVAEFVVTTSGNITDIRILNSVTDGIDQEMIRVLEETNGNWRPGIANGKAVNMKREVSVVFKPNKNYNLKTIAKKSQLQGEEQLMVEKQPKKAIKYYDRAISLLPYEQSFLAVRGLCKYEIGDEIGANKDWERILYLNKYNPKAFNFQTVMVNPAMSVLKGYSKLMQLLEKK